MLNTSSAYMLGEYNKRTIYIEWFSKLFPNLDEHDKKIGRLKISTASEMVAWFIDKSNLN